jgi:branched-chain amino acid aminotransferase
MNSAIHSYYVQNGIPVDCRYYLTSVAEGQDAIYEVIRLVEGVPLFFEDHYKRLKKSSRLIGKKLRWTKADVKKSIRRLVEANRVTLGNIEIMVQWEEEEKKGILYGSFIPFRYPTDEHFEKGVRVGLMEAERLNPNAKILNQGVREQADQLMKEKNYYEVLLVNREGYITEGSRSNFFAIMDNKFVTPPADVVLPGITRGKVLELAVDLNIKVSERLVHRDELPELEAAFITGTSPCVLPISHIEDLQLNPDLSLLRKLQSAYNDLMCNYLRSHNTLCTEGII